MVHLPQVGPRAKAPDLRELLSAVRASFGVADGSLIEKPRRLGPLAKALLDLDLVRPRVPKQGQKLTGQSLLADWLGM